MGELPLNDPRWYTLKAAIDRREQQTGAVSLVVTDLERDLESDKLRSMRRNLLTGECEHVPAIFWRDHVIDITLPPHIEVYRRRDIDRTPQRWGTFAHQAADRINGWVFFVWKPDFDRLYFASAPVDQHDARGTSPSAQEPTPQQRKPRKQGGGRRPKFERGNWLGCGSDTMSP